MVEDAISYYHQALTERGEAGPAEWQRFLDGLIEARISYGGRRLCPFLRPKFITRAWHDRIVEVCHTLRGAIVKVKDALLSEPELLDVMGLTPGERRLLAIEPGYRSIGVSTRLDSFLCGDELKFVELNAECPAGVAFSDAMQDHFADFAPLNRVRERFKVSGFDTRGTLLYHLLETFKEWGGQGLPKIAIVDWREVSTRNEFLISADFFNEKGVPTRVLDPRELEYVGGRLVAGGEPIDLIYRRVLTNDVLDRPDECKALLEAYQARAVCVVNSFRAKLLHKKMLFALLHDERLLQSYTLAERAVVERHIPWTARVVDGRVRGPEGQEIELVSFIQRSREELVLKPNDEYGGKGVIVGHTVDDGAWEEGLKAALATTDSIVQRRVGVPTEDFPLLGEGGELAFEPRYVDLDPYLFRGECGGILTRLSATSLCNVTAGGGSVPTFVLDPLTGGAS